MSHAQPTGVRDITRRKFILGCVAIAVSAAAGCVVGLPPLDGSVSSIALAESDGWLTLGPLANLVPGVPAGFPYVRKVKDGWIESVQTGIAYVVTRNGRDVQVLANVCSHGGCRVTWQQEQAAFVCPCHRGQFAIDGQVLAGPPSRPLEVLPSRVVAGQVQVSLEV